MEIRKATLSDWYILREFYNNIYRPNHPLHNFDFFKWQYGDEKNGVALYAIEGNAIIGHLGLNMVDGYAWHINLYISENYRASNTLVSMIEASEAYGKQGGIAANEKAVKVLRALKWYQHYNLIRLTKINPLYTGMDDILKPVEINSAYDLPPGHFWKQPTLKGVQLPDGSTAVVQNEVGGLRFVHLNQPSKALAFAWEAGFRWVDFVSSFNNPLLQKLEKKGWKTDKENNIPWLLNPVQENRFAEITFLTKDPIDIDFYINRTHSDIGRVGSIYSAFKLEEGRDI